ncbi:MAG: hypothetical protein QOE90_3622 [Thermoplasmata archaeon]|jgi:hypothetical protein|nr:hypothetical protein [Thermoplasmata archaeon]
MEGTTHTRDDETTPRTLQPHAALIPAAASLNGPHVGWHFAVLVRAAWSRLEGSA